MVAVVMDLSRLFLNWSLVFEQLPNSTTRKNCKWSFTGSCDFTVKRQTIILHIFL